MIDRRIQPGQPAAGDAVFIVRMRDLKDPHRTWNLPVTEELLIGRADRCQIQFLDPSVSRVQCKIVVRGGALMVVQVGTTNHTRCNGMVVTGYAQLNSGDVLKFGRESLAIDSIQRQDLLEPLPGVPSEYDEEGTMSFF